MRSPPPTEPGGLVGWVTKPLALCHPGGTFASGDAVMTPRPGRATSRLLAQVTARDAPGLGGEVALCCTGPFRSSQGGFATWNARLPEAPWGLYARKGGRAWRSTAGLFESKAWRKLKLPRPLTLQWPELTQKSLTAWDAGNHGPWQHRMLGIVVPGSMGCWESWSLAA